MGGCQGARRGEPNPVTAGLLPPSLDPWGLLRQPPQVPRGRAHGTSSLGSTRRHGVTHCGPKTAQFRPPARTVSLVTERATREGEQRNRQLVAYLLETGVLRDGAVRDAFAATPRHLFLPDLNLDEVYQDAAIPTKRGSRGEPISSSSQPAIMAIMLEQLRVKPGQRVLEIGAGTGYNAALLAHLVDSGGRVVTLDYDEDLCGDASAVGRVPPGAGPAGLGHGDVLRVHAAPGRGPLQPGRHPAGRPGGGAAGARGAERGRAPRSGPAGGVRDVVRPDPPGLRDGPPRPVGAGHVRPPGRGRRGGRGTRG